MDTQPTQIPGLAPSQPLPFLSHQQEQNQHRIPVELPQPRAATDSIDFSKGMPGKANQPTNEPPMNSYRYNIPAPIIPAPPPVQKHVNFEKTTSSTLTTTAAAATWCGTGDSSATHVRLTWRDSTSVSSLLLTQGCTPWRSSTSP